MIHSSFKQKAAEWRQRFQHQQSAGFLQRFLAWLLLGVLLIVAVSVMLFLLLLSWLLIPILLYQYRRKVKAWQQKNQQEPTQGASRVIEGEVISSKDH